MIFNLMEFWRYLASHVGLDLEVAYSKTNSGGLALKIKWIKIKARNNSMVNKLTRSGGFHFPTLHEELSWGWAWTFSFPTREGEHVHFCNKWTLHPHSWWGGSWLNMCICYQTCAFTLYEEGAGWTCVFVIKHVYFHNRCTCSPHMGGGWRCAFKLT